MKKWGLFLFGLFLYGLVRGQDKPTQSIPDMLSRVHIVQPDTARLGLMLNIANAYVLKPGEEKTDLDSALLLIGQVEAANTQHNRDPRIAGLCDLIAAKAWRERGNDSLAKIAALRALDTFRHQNDPLDLAYAYCSAANYYDINRFVEDSIRVNYLRHAIPIFDSFGRTDQQARFRESLGESLLTLNGAEAALPVLLESRKFYLSTGHNDLRNLYSLIGTCYGDIGDVQQAIDYEFKSLRLEEARKPPEPSIITTYARLARTYYAAEQNENAADMYQKGYEWALRLKSREAGFMGTNLAISLTKVGRSKEALDTFKRVDAWYYSDNHDPLQRNRAYLILYLALNQRDQMARYGEKIDSLLNKMTLRISQRATTLLILTRYAMAMQQFDRAKRYDLEGIEACRNLASLPQLVACYKVLYQIDSVKGDQAAILRDFRRYVEVRDSANDVTHSRQIAGLKVEYEVEKKDDSIRSLTQSQLLSQNALRQTGIARNATVAAAILLLVLLLVAVNRYLLKQRSNRQLQLQKMEIDKQNGELHTLVDEKEELLVIKDWLMKELNHRVGNNLHFMMSVQNMQAHNLNSTEALNAIMQSNNRLYAMSLIHRKLYQPDSEGSIDMAQYIGDLVKHLSEALSPDHHIELATHVAPVELDVSQAVPVGLILNEAITNAFKYAFDYTQSGPRQRIDISLQPVGENELEATIKDNGKGYTPVNQQGKRSSLGFVLIEMLTKQLRGILTMRNEEGLTIRIRFPAKFQLSEN